MTTNTIVEGLIKGDKTTCDIRLGFERIDCGVVRKVIKQHKQVPMTICGRGKRANKIVPDDCTYVSTSRQWRFRFRRRAFAKLSNQAVFAKGGVIISKRDARDCRGRDRLLQGLMMSVSTAFVESTERDCLRDRGSISQHHHEGAALAMAFEEYLRRRFKGVTKEDFTVCTEESVHTSQGERRDGEEIVFGGWAHKSIADGQHAFTITRSRGSHGVSVFSSGNGVVERDSIVKHVRRADNVMRCTRVNNKRSGIHTAGTSSRSSSLDAAESRLWSVKESLITKRLANGALWWTRRWSASEAFGHIREVVAFFGSFLGWSLWLGA
ncbi:hypothetical protein EDD86DRAFT_56829 [Gorgonomyces haynaldii]|nr:hypothetical protein EDD86DRAFT_56829 [Gorgonomyces haynaldii]